MGRRRNANDGLDARCPRSFGVAPSNSSEHDTRTASKPSLVEIFLAATGLAAWIWCAYEVVSVSFR